MHRIERSCLEANEAVPDVEPVFGWLVSLIGRAVEDSLPTVTVDQGKVALTNSDSQIRSVLRSAGGDTPIASFFRMVPSVGEGSAELAEMLAGLWKEDQVSEKRAKERKRLARLKAKKAPDLQLKTNDDHRGEVESGRRVEDCEALLNDDSRAASERQSYGAVYNGVAEDGGPLQCFANGLDQLRGRLSWLALMRHDPEGRRETVVDAGWWAGKRGIEIARLGHLCQLLEQVQAALAGLVFQPVEQCARVGMLLDSLMQNWIPMLTPGRPSASEEAEFLQLRTELEACANVFRQGARADLRRRLPLLAGSAAPKPESDSADGGHKQELVSPKPESLLRYRDAVWIGHATERGLDSDRLRQMRNRRTLLNAKLITKRWLYDVDEVAEKQPTFAKRLLEALEDDADFRKRRQAEKDRRTKPDKAGQTRTRADETGQVTG